MEAYDCRARNNDEQQSQQPASLCSFANAESPMSIATSTEQLDK
jgi:hypothetical protein